MDKIISATVTKDFKGVPDGEVYPKDYVAGDELTGDLAALAVRDGNATADEVETIAPPPREALAGLTKDELTALAAAHSVDIAGAKTKGEIIAALLAADVSPTTPVPGPAAEVSQPAAAEVTPPAPAA